MAVSSRPRPLHALTLQVVGTLVFTSRQYLANADLPVLITPGGVLLA